jgi:hypothetical protein
MKRAPSLVPALKKEVLLVTLMTVTYILLAQGE